MTTQTSERFATARAVADAVDSVRGVGGRHAGAVGEFATFGLGGKVEGVRVRDGQVEVRVVARYGACLPDLADEVRDRVLDTVDATPPPDVDIVIADVERAE